MLSPRSITPIAVARDLDDLSKFPSPESEPLITPRPTRIPEVGEVIQEKFLLESCIGVGGMGVVFRGEHLQLKKQIAIKCLRTELVGDSVALQRFLQEARLAASIENEHSTRIYDVGTTNDGLPFIVMEYLGGTALDTYLETHGALSSPEAVAIILQLLAVLAEAHGKGLVHRDLKPANLFLQERADGALWVKVMDFGISKNIKTDPAKLEITAPHSLLGSPEYMSPEQLRDSSSITHLSDIWSVGVILYELLTAKVPFESHSLAELCASILDRKALPVRTYRGDVPPGLDAIVLRALAKDPKDRPQTVGELALLLAAYAPESARGSAFRINAICLKSSRSTSSRTPIVIDTEQLKRRRAREEEETQSVAGKPLLSRRTRSTLLGLALLGVVGALSYLLTPTLTRQASHERPGSFQLESTAVTAIPPPPLAQAIASTVASTDGAATTAPSQVQPPRRPAPPAPPPPTRIRKPSEIKPLE